MTPPRPRIQPIRILIGILAALNAIVLPVAAVVEFMDLTTVVSVASAAAPPPATLRDRGDEHWFADTRGRAGRYAMRAPSTTTPRGVLVLLHGDGDGDSYRRYLELSADVAERQGLVAVSLAVPTPDR